METKLTLRINKETIEKARKYAADRDLELSDMIKNYLASLPEENKEEQQQFEPKTITNQDTGTALSLKLKKIVGAVNLPADFNEETERHLALKKKH